MRRADRLFRILQILRRSELTTADAIASELEVTKRTIYRDVADLIASGVPIRGEAGVGYVLEAGFDLPPLMFERDELEALVAGCRIVAAHADDELAKAAHDVLAKVQAVLPPAWSTRLDAIELRAPDFGARPESSRHMAELRAAIRQRKVLRLNYTDAEGAGTQRIVQPLALYFWGSQWTLLAWCELRADFRSFRLDRTESVESTGDRFTPEPGRRIENFLARMRAE